MSIITIPIFLVKYFFNKYFAGVLFSPLSIEWNMILEYERQENQRQKLATDRKEADLRYERQKQAEGKRKVTAERRSIAVEQYRKKTATAPKSQTYGFSNSEMMRVRFDSSGIGSHEGEFGAWENIPKSLNLMTIRMIFKSLWN